ncbi:MAG: asparagine synthase-related protein [Hyphomonadaceae bacterium]
MRSFIAMIWDASDTLRQQQVEAWTADFLSASKAWRCIGDFAGLRILADLSFRAPPLCLGRVQGAIIGSIFESGTQASHALQTLPAQAEDALGARGSTFLLDHYWGGYVAIWHGDDGAVHALRDPSGAIACFVSRIKDVELLSSDPALLADFASAEFAIDPNYLQAFILENYLATPRCGLRDVCELLPGQVMRLSGGARGEACWAFNAAEVCARPHAMDFEEASQAVRKAAEAATASWAKAYGRIAIRLSGGLDSTVLLGLFSQHPGLEIEALHLVGIGYEADEVALARLAAHRAGVRLTELTYDPRAVRLDLMLDGPRLSRPSKQVLGVAALRLESEAVERSGTQCIIAGHGGDALFLQGALASAMLSDFIRLRGLSRGFWRVAYDTAVSQEQPVTRVVLDVLRDLQSRSQTSRLVRALERFSGQDLLVREAFEGPAERYFDNAWLATAPDLPTGKLQQVENVIALRHYWSLQGFGPACEEVLPFLSQPLLDLALRTPTFILGQGGVDRSLERHAFADLIPQEVQRRTGKGVINHQLLTTLSNNLPFLKDLLLNGYAVGQGWISPSALERALSRERFAQGGRIETILNLVAAETWVRSWQD